MSSYTSLQVHRRMLEDAGRVAANAAAIAATVRPGDVVVDLGSGTGLLAFLACRAGARRIHAIERTDLVELARRLAAGNGFEDRVVFHHADSRELELPERADVLLCDWLGPMGFDGGMFEELLDARDRFLAPGGRLAPAGVGVALAPLETQEAGEAVAFWERPLAGLDLSAAADFAANAADPAPPATPGRLLARPAVIREIEVATVRALPFQAEVCFRPSRPGLLHGFAGFMAAHMAPGLVLSNSPDPAWAGRRAGDGGRVEVLQRPARFFPLRRPLEVREGDEIALVFAAGVLGGRPLWVWQGELRREGRTVAAFSHDSLRGTPLTKERLQSAETPAAIALGADA